MATSEESMTRFHAIFDDSFPHFDGTSTTSPNTDVQRVYEDAAMRSLHLQFGSSPLPILGPFTRLIDDLLA